MLVHLSLTDGHGSRCGDGVNIIVREDGMLVHYNLASVIRVEELTMLCGREGANRAAS